MMSSPSNLNSVSYSADLNTSASVFFNNIYQPGFTTSQNIDNAVIAHFERITESKESAKIMASAVIYTSLAQRVDPMETLQKFMSMDAESLRAYTSMFLNLNRTNTSYLGLINRPKTSPYVSRSILA